MQLINFICKNVFLQGAYLTEQVIIELNNEITRLEYSIHYFILRKKFAEKYNEKHKTNMDKIKSILKKKYDQKMFDEIKSIFNEILITNSAVKITIYEKAQINKALNLTGHWFRCRNKHPYVITECGGAMETAICPVEGCNSQIGGSNHELVEGNEHDGDMDNSLFPAWSNCS